MNAITTQAQSLTLLDLVQALGSVLDDDAAVASAVGTLVNAGAVKFQGDLAGRRVRIVPSAAALVRLAA
ncbi:MAG: hypothetical protein U0610_11285 [bacterium]